MLTNSVIFVSLCQMVLHVLHVVLNLHGKRRNQNNFVVSSCWLLQYKGRGTLLERYRRLSLDLLVTCATFGVPNSQAVWLHGFFPGCNDTSSSGHKLQHWHGKSHRGPKPQHCDTCNYHSAKDRQWVQCWSPHEANYQLHVWYCGWVQDCCCWSHSLSMSQVPPEVPHFVSIVLCFVLLSILQISQIFWLIIKFGARFYHVAGLPWVCSWFFVQCISLLNSVPLSCVIEEFNSNEMKHTILVFSSLYSPKSGIYGQV